MTPGQHIHKDRMYRCDGLHEKGGYFNFSRPSFKINVKRLNTSAMYDSALQWTVGEKSFHAKMTMSNSALKW